MVTALLAALLVAGDAEARRSSSGGYSRPSISSRPSVSIPRRPSIAPSTPSRPPASSGGYARPTAPPSTGQWAPVQRTPRVLPPQGAGDRDVQRRTSVDALADYRRQQERRQQDESRFSRPSLPPPASAPRPPGGWSQGPRYERYDDWSRARTVYYGERGWSPPPYAYQSRPSFGMWDAAMLWYLLDNLRRPGSAEFFHHHRDDPGYRSWRAEADRLAGDNADLRGKLQSLDSELVARDGQPRDPAYVPPGFNPSIGLASNRAVRPVATREASGFGMLTAIVVLVAGAALFIWLWRRREAPASARPTTPAAELGKPMSKFRVGMTVSLDPTPFTLAGDAIRVSPPVADGNGRVGIEAIGSLSGQGVEFHRLYLPGGDSFFQVHLDADGMVDECRYFARHDEVAPSSADEWGFWLDEREGVIGWPEFDTKDGKRHARVWSAGEGRVTPLRLNETIQALDGPWTRTHDAMLYAVSTGLAPPAPEAEYLMVAAVEGSGGARVELHLGIDINPASL